MPRPADHPLDRCQKLAVARLKDALDASDPRYALALGQPGALRDGPTLDEAGWHLLAPLERRYVMLRDGCRCVRCGTEYDLTVDHILPLSRGGTDVTENLQAIGGRCNMAKGNRLPGDSPLTYLLPTPASPCG